LQKRGRMEKFRPGTPRGPIGRLTSKEKNQMGQRRVEGLLKKGKKKGVRDGMVGGKRGGVFKGWWEWSQQGRKGSFPTKENFDLKPKRVEKKVMGEQFGGGPGSSS